MKYHKYKLLVDLHIDKHGNVTYEIETVLENVTGDSVETLYMCAYLHWTVDVPEKYVNSHCVTVVNFRKPLSMIF